MEQVRVQERRRHNEHKEKQGENDQLASVYANFDSAIMKMNEQNTFRKV